MRYKFYLSDIKLSKDYVALVNSLGSLLSSCVALVDDSNNLPELWLKRGTSNEEAIDVWLGDQLTAVTGVGGATVLDSRSGGHIGADVLGQP